MQNYWAQAYDQQVGQPYQDIRTVKYSGRRRSGCGAASSSMGPFYCPNDKLVYLDTSFMQDMLQGQLGAKGGPFALAYVIAHEYGHHVQDQLGVLGKIRTQQGAEERLGQDRADGRLPGRRVGQERPDDDRRRRQPDHRGPHPGRHRRAIDAAQAVGDDRIQKQTSGRVNPDAWTHGSSEQRVHWFNVGLEKGTIEACNTFSAGSL